MYALANELTYQHLLRQRNDNNNKQHQQHSNNSIEMYIREAIAAYKDVGALAKVQHITITYNLS
jgi:hypothetical protein